ncbi:MAG: TOMM precursor leader peptide-binding protein [Gammaproteobacteria bacterium]|nr:TOMM precursor leader peptide-binding protein [Gammaproteobacteria bacterium]
MPTGQKVFLKTASDTGLIERPVLAPHFRFYAVDSKQVFLISESFNTLLHGQIYPHLLPLLDGLRSYREILKALQGEHSESSVKSALISLSSKGYVVSGDHRMETNLVAFWTSLGISPRFVEEKLSASKVSLIGESKVLTQGLEAMGVSVAKEKNQADTLRIVICDDYLDDRHNETNQQQLASGVPWVLVRAGGLQPMLGPVFHVDGKGPCWACLAYRLCGHQEVHNFLRNFTDGDIDLSSQAMAPATLEAVYSIAALEIVKWLVVRENATISRNALTLDVANLSISLHPIARRPQCQTCGDESLYRNDRRPIPVILNSSPTHIRNSGGVRAVSSQDTLAKYKHLIDPVGGVVTWLRRTTGQSDSWLHVHWSGSNLALKNRALSVLRLSLRTKSAGKGSTPEQSEASALCEALERYCGAFHGDEIRSQHRFSEFGTNRMEAIHPNNIQLFSERQFDDAENINASGHPYNVVPPRLDLDAAIDWSPVWSFTRDRHIHIPTSLLYYGKSTDHRGLTDFVADSNGCAAGNTIEEAILQGFFELVERDAFAIWWYNRLRMPEVDLSSFDDEYLASAKDYYRNLNRELWVLDITSDFKIPSFVAVSHRVDKQAEDIIYGAGTHMDAHIAILRAVCELNQFLNWVQGTGPGGAGYQVNDPQCLWWWKNALVSEHAYLAPASGTKPLCQSSYPVYESEDLREDVDKCRALVEGKGMEFLALDQTRPDIGMPVVRVIVPGMRHYWQRFAPGRLYDIPVQTGILDRSLTEDEINTSPVIG